MGAAHQGLSPPPPHTTPAHLEAAQVGDGQLQRRPSILRAPPQFAVALLQAVHQDDHLPVACTVRRGGGGGWEGGGHGGDNTHAPGQGPTCPCLYAAGAWPLARARFICRVLAGCAQGQHPVCRPTAAHTYTPPPPPPLIPPTFCSSFAARLASRSISARALSNSCCVCCVGGQAL